MYGKLFSRNQTSNHKWQWSKGTDKKQNTWALQPLWEVDTKKGWVPKNWCLELWCWKRLLKSLLDSKEIKSVNSKGNQSWICTGRTDAEVEAPMLWPPDTESWIIRKDPDAGKDWRQEQKGTTEDKMVEWHHRLNRHEFEQAPGDSEDREAWCAAVHEVAKS